MSLKLMYGIEILLRGVPRRRGIMMMYCDEGRRKREKSNLNRPNQPQSEVTKALTGSFLLMLRLIHAKEGAAT